MSSGFVTESEAAEARQRRQEEWERVRKPEDPLERPEEPYDGRSLFERLKEQKVKKDMEYEEAHKLKNLIRGLDDDEVQFLELVDQQKISAERKQALEEEKELKEFRNRVATLQEEFADKRLQSELKLSKGNTAASTSCARPSQKKLLGLGIKRKNGEGTSGTDANSAASSNTRSSNTEECKKGLESNVEQAHVAPKTHLSITTNRYDKGALKCVAILPGIGSYTESSDSEMSSGSEEEFGGEGRYDLCGRKRQKKKDCSED